MLLDHTNYTQGVLIDHEWMAGITLDAERIIVYIVNHQTAEMLVYQAYPSLIEALSDLNGLKREWTFETFKACGKVNCAQDCQKCC